MPSARFFYTNFLAAGAGGEADWPEAMTRLKSEAALDPRRGAALRLIEKMDLDDRGHPRSLPPEQRLCEEMEVRLFAQLFTPEECTYVIAQAEPEFRRSTVADQLGGREYVDAARNSEGSTLHWFLADPAVHALNQRLASASHSSVKQGEHLHILRYGVGQEFRPHYDWSETVDNQRIKTALVYLNEDYEGGETLFVESGLKVKGRTGDAIVFRNATDEGDRDMKAMHAGLPVTSGTKLIASKWVRASRCAEYWG
jgi:prolyl 4-hydroxylase